MNLYGKNEYIAKYEGIKKKLRVILNQNAWDGDWFKRAYMDDGKVLGTRRNEECKIDSIAQSWSVISGAGDEYKKKRAMESLEEFLMDKDIRNYKTSYTSF